MFKKPTSAAFYSKSAPIRDFVLHYSDFGLDLKRLSWHKKLMLLAVRYGFVLFYWYLNLYAVRVIASCVRDIKRALFKDVELEYDYLVKKAPINAGKKMAFKTIGLLLRIFDHCCLLVGLTFRDAKILFSWQLLEGIQVLMQYMIYISNVCMGDKNMIKKEKVVATVFRTYVWFFTLLIGYYFDNSYLTESLLVRSRGHWF